MQQSESNLGLHEADRAFVEGLDGDDFLIIDTQAALMDEETKKFNDYLYHRVLVRPPVSWWSAVRYAVHWLFGAGAFSTAELLAERYLLSNVVSESLFRHWMMLFIPAFALIVLVNLKRIIIFLVKMYQKTASEETRKRCCCMPSCSEYMIMAVNKYGALIGVFKGLFRLWRCGSFRGIDYP